MITTEICLGHLGKRSAEFAAAWVNKGRLEHLNGFIKAGTLEFHISKMTVATASNEIVLESSSHELALGACNWFSADSQTRSGEESYVTSK